MAAIWMRSLAPMTRPDDFAPRAKALPARLRPRLTPPAVLRKSRRFAAFPSDMEVPHFELDFRRYGVTATPSLLLATAGGNGAARGPEARQTSPCYEGCLYIE